MIGKEIFIALVLLCSFSSFAPAAAQEGKGAHLPVPRFVTLGADKINLRTGPGTRYPIRLVISKDGLPVEIIREFDIWRQIRDADGDEGWVLKSMLSGKRAVVVKGAARAILKSPADGARPMAKLEPGVIAALKTCRKDWCEVAVAGYSGWLKRAHLWGVYPSETFGE